MSRAICPKCGKTDVSWIRDDADCAQYVCLECKQSFCYPPKTVFEHITESVEALAKNLIYVRTVKFRGLYSIQYMSTLTGDTAYSTDEEAISATLTELKKVANAN